MEDKLKGEGVNWYNYRTSLHDMRICMQLRCFRMKRAFVKCWLWGSSLVSDGQSNTVQRITHLSTFKACVKLEMTELNCVYCIFTIQNSNITVSNRCTFGFAMFNISLKKTPQYFVNYKLLKMSVFIMGCFKIYPVRYMKYGLMLGWMLNENKFIRLESFQCKETVNWKRWLIWGTSISFK